MADEGTFLRAVLANPADDLPRLVYADWLDDQGTEESLRKAEFLRLQHTTGRRYDKNKRHKRNWTRIRELAAGLPAGWLVAVSHAAVENCESGGTSIHKHRLRVSLNTVQFVFNCPKDWAGLTPTADDKVRHCSACEKDVFYCDTVAEARTHAWVGDCVAVRVSEERRAGDLSMPEVTMGIALPPPGYLGRLPGVDEDE